MDDMTWMLAALSTGSEGSQMVIDGVRDVEDDERKALLDANSVLAVLTENSAYSTLHRAHERWVSTFQAAHGAAAQRHPDHRRMFLEDLPEAVNNLLFAFRAFVDQSERWVVKAFGKNSSEHEAYLVQRKQEYDSKLAYRIGWNLRNTSQHRSSILTIQARSAHLPNGTQSFELDVCMARDAVDAKWQAPVRNEVAKIPHPIYVAPVIDGVVDCCERIHARVLLLAQPLAMPAARRLLDARAEVSQVGRQVAGAVLAVSDWQRLGVARREPLTMTPLRSDLADVYVGNIPQAQVLLSD